MSRGRPAGHGPAQGDWYVRRGRPARQVHGGEHFRLEVAIAREEAVGGGHTTLHRRPRNSRSSPLSRQSTSSLLWILSSARKLFEHLGRFRVSSISPGVRSDLAVSLIGRGSARLPCEGLAWSPLLIAPGRRGDRSALSGHSHFSSVGTGPEARGEGVRVGPGWGPDTAPPSVVNREVWSVAKSSRAPWPVWVDAKQFSGPRYVCCGRGRSS